MSQDNRESAKMARLRKSVVRSGRTSSGGRRSSDESTVDSFDRDALARWEGEGGALAEVRQEKVQASNDFPGSRKEAPADLATARRGQLQRRRVRKTREKERAKQDSMTYIDDNAMEEASSAQSAKDVAAEAAGNPAEQGGQG
jgi:hypothetical protein